MVLTDTIGKEGFAKNDLTHIFSQGLPDKGTEDEK
jgi:hypothetical protein